MVKKTSIALLGTDIFGTYLTESLLSSGKTNLLQVGSPPGEHELENLKVVAKKFPGYFPADSKNPVQNFENQLHKIQQADKLHAARPVDLKPTPEGFYILTEKNNSHRTLAARVLVVSTPAAIDLLEDGFVLPGADSAVTGLLGNYFNFSFRPNSTGYLINYNSNSSNWRGDWGFKTDENCATDHGRIFIAGEARAGKPNRQALEQLSGQLSETDPGVAEELDSNPFSPPYEDVDLPRNFCPAKTEKLKKLTSRLLGRDKIDEKLAAQFRQFCGEIAAYSRFRSHPRLKRLFYKTLAARKLSGINGPEKQ
ncbi:MAG: hypothetical protein ACQEP7_03865 [bacterium]